MKKGYSLLYISMIFSAFGGLIVGFQTGVIAGVLLFLKGKFALGSTAKELLVASLLIGALIGTVIAGWLSDLLGRKLILLLFALIGVVSSFFLTMSPNIWVMFSSRFACGIAVGGYFVIIPVYIAEIALKEHRGGFIALFQLAITLGLLLGFYINYLFANAGCFHASFALGFVLSLIHFVLLFFIARSPRWLFAKGHHDKAHEVMNKLYTPDRMEERLKKMVSASVGESSVRMRDLFKPGLFSALVAGVGLAMFQQLCGINTVMYYGPIIFERVGFDTTKEALLASVIIGCVNVGATILAFFLIDRMKRKSLLLIGSGGMALSLLFLALGYQFSSISLTALICYVIFFAISLGPITFVLISEIFPTAVRGKAAGMAIFANNVMNVLVSVSFLTLLDWLGTKGVFYLYMILCVIAFFYILEWIPETKGKSLEEIQEYWKKT